MDGKRKPRGAAGQSWGGPSKLNSRAILELNFAVGWLVFAITLLCSWGIYLSFSSVLKCSLRCRFDQEFSKAVIGV